MKDAQESVSERVLKFHVKLHNVASDCTSLPRLQSRRRVRALPTIRGNSASAPRGQHVVPSVTTSTDSIAEVTATMKKAIVRDPRDALQVLMGKDLLPDTCCLK